jgi:protein involved in polysaccharide export with SLBB domain
VVNIGRRAIISIDGKPMLATHWDGYPASLGRDLLNCDKSIKAVIEVAKGHTIDAADPQVLEAVNRERISQLAEKHQLTVREIKAGIRRGNVISADDYEITDLRTYRDLAEFHFDIRGSEVFFRPLDGWWPDALKQAGEIELLSEEEVIRSRAE